MPCHAIYTRTQSYHILHHTAIAVHNAIAICIVLYYIHEELILMQTGSYVHTFIAHRLHQLLWYNRIWIKLILTLCVRIEYAVMPFSSSYQQFFIHPWIYVYMVRRARALIWYSECYSAFYFSTGRTTVRLKSLSVGSTTSREPER